MGANSKIEWTDHTFNPWVGCTKVSPACDNCYAEAWAKRSGRVKWGDNPRARTNHINWAKPRLWNKKAEAAGTRPKVFCASLADVFDNQVDPEWVFDLFELIQRTPCLDWLILTKRPQNILKLFPDLFDLGVRPNVWLGTTVENQAEADRRIPWLLEVPAVKHFLSCEPLLGQLELRPYLAWSGARVDWVICGGESGSGARPMHPGWARSLRDQCEGAGVPFFFKQWGDWRPHVYGEGGEWGTIEFDGHFWPVTTPWTGEEGSTAGQVMNRVGKVKAGHLLDGEEFREFPA